jgi:hypothetical protein
MNMIDSSAAIASDMMFVGSRDGLLYVFGSEITPPYIRGSILTSKSHTL